MQEYSSEKQDKQRKKKWKYVIKYWLGRSADGEWIPESVATDVKRTFERHTHGKGSTKLSPVIVKETVEELVYAHHGYRPNFENEKKTRTSFFFRGARIWRD